ncbi:MAG: putative porin [Candidatus Omnitrophota bacterium]
MRKVLWAGLVMVAALSLAIPSARAGEVDLLIQKLVDKGVLSPGEGQEILVETKEEIKKQNVRGTNESIPSWVQTVKLKGDMRLRHELDQNKGLHNDNRTRIRMRLGVEAKPNDQMTVGIGLATGKLSDPRSTNVTLGQNSGSKNTPNSWKDITLDYAYAQYKPVNGLTLTGGKIKNPVWQPNDLLWDGDINPDGIAAQISYGLLSNVDVFMNNMLMILTEDRLAKDAEPYMVAIQPGIKWGITDNVNLKLAAAYYNFSGVQERSSFVGQSTNSLDASSKYMYNYNSINPSIELGVKEPLGGLVPYFGMFGDYVQNLSLPSGVSGRSGYDYGIKFGAEKVKGSGQWQAKLSYDTLGKDAFLDIFPDSDRYSGKTNMNSYEASLEYGIGKNTSLGLDYYWSESRTKTNGTTSPAQVLQFDWNLKF